MPASVSVLGVTELLARFARGLAIAEVAEKHAVDSLGEDVERLASDLAPVDTGTLRDSIRYEDGRVYTDVEYAPFVEYGTVNAPAQPFMRPAADTVDDSHAVDEAAVVLRTI